MRINTTWKTLQIFLNFSLAPMALWWKISKRSLFQSKLVNICNHSSDAWEHNCENCSLALSATTADIHFHSNKIWANISILFSEIDRALIMVAGTIDATARVVLWRRGLFSNIFAPVATRKSRHSFRKTSFCWYITLAQKTFCFSTNINGSFKLSLLLTSSLLSCCGVVALSIRSLFMNLFIKTRRTLNNSACKNGTIGASVWNLRRWL